ncbi:MAG: hypothetical protein IJW20_01250 [Clostridia bacterium]|nr:hypothetical protein [Clostridia bacterium]
MRLLKETLKRIVLIIITISILITFLATPVTYAKLDLEEGEFYYSGTTKGTYVPSQNIFSWLINALAQIADYILGFLSLIVRMPFVGWTALLEKLLTWALESTMGVSADGSMVGTSVNEDGEVEINSADLTGLTDSSNNVTVEAIVYNRVAALDIDIFDVEFDRTLSATGQKLVCKNCQKQEIASGSKANEYISKPVEECIDTEKVKQDAAALKTRREAGEEVEPLDVEDYCTCDCGGCDACAFYIAQLQQDEPIIFKLKQLVATWYTIIRYLAIAAMLIVLIGIGIKMAVSTIASDKAVYKRMLVDWVVGFILLFAIHYFMMFVINVNEVVVNVIADSAQSINKVQVTELGLEEAVYTDSELELKIYEEVRTRAYDAKLSNGMIGMLMYMTLVFFAFKYTIIYLKRFLTIVVLTLMAPAIGLAYALQKALSGKSAALKTWMTEYIMNVIIQIVHALIYSIFISQALILSLQNVAGMIVALILMNYTSKADELFKKIFKFGGGDSLLGHTEGAAGSLKENMDTAMGFAAGAKPMAKALTNTPYGKAVKAIGKMGVAGAVGLAGGVTNAIRNHREETADERHQKEIDKEMDRSQGGVEPKKNSSGEYYETDEEYNARRAKAEAIVNARKNPNAKLDDELRATGGHQLKADMDKAKAALDAEGDNPKEETKQQYLQATQRYNRFNQIQIPTNKAIAKGHLERLISMENVFTTGKPTGKYAGFKTAWTAAMGTYHRDKRTGKKVSDGNSVFDQLRPKELLGLTDQDTKQLKEIGGDMIKGLVGMGSLFVGMGTIVASPKAGMALLANGVASTSKVFGRDTNIARSPGNYKFGRFGSQSIDAIRNSALARAQYEHDAILAADLKKRHPELVRNLKEGIASGVTVGTLESGALAFTAGGVAAASAFLPVAVATGAATMATARLTRHSALAGKMADFDRHCSKQQREQIDKFNKEADKEQLNSIKADQEYRNMIFFGQVDKDLDKNKDEKIEKKYKEILDADYKETDGTLEVKTAKVDEEEVKLTQRATINDWKPSDVAKTLDKELDRIIADMTATGETIDITSKAVQTKIMKNLGLDLESKKILRKGEAASEILKDGEAALIRKIKLKGTVRNAAVVEAKKKLEGSLEKEKVEEVQNIIEELVQPNKEGSKKDSKKLSEITVDDIIDRMKPTSKDGSQSVDSKDGSQSATDPDKKKKTKQPIDDATKAAIEEYLKSVQKEATSTTIKGDGVNALLGDVKEESKVRAKRAVESDKKEKKDNIQKKLSQVLSAAIDIDKGLIDENGKLKREVATDGSVTIAGEKLTKQETSYVDATVKSLLEMKELNEKVLKRETKLKKDGSQKYLSNMRSNSADTIAISQYKKEMIECEIEKDSKEPTRRSTQEIAEDINKLSEKIKERENNIAKRNQRMSIDGPVQNIEYYIKKDVFKGRR